MNRIGLQLEPLDVLFFRDGRPFGVATRGESGLPTPQTLLGALRLTALERYCPKFAGFRHQPDRPRTWDGVCDQAAAPSWLRRMYVRGPWLARVLAKDKLDVLVPVPAILHGPKKNDGGSLRRLWPLRAGQLPGWGVALPDEQHGLRPLWSATQEATEPARGYLTLAGLAAFVSGDTVQMNSVIRPEDLFAFDHRTGIRGHADRLVAEESQIYGASFLALRSHYTARELHEVPRQLPEVVLYAEVTGPDGIPRDGLADLTALRLGGEGRRVAVRAVDPIGWPEAGPTGNQKPLLLLTTPGLFQGRWRPGSLAGQLVAAAVPTPVAVSGWDLARGGPKPTRFAAPAGSVYFLDSLTASLPDTLSDKPEDRELGWGCYVQGVWTDA